MKLNITRPAQVEVKYIHIYTKICDGLCFTIKDNDEKELWEQDHGYVPDFFPGKNYGDYLDLKIDIDTGQIVNWEKVDSEEIENLINKKQGNY